MTDNKKKIIYSAMLLIGLAVFILEVFVFQKPDGVLGFIICLTSIYMIGIGIFKLCKLSEKFGKNLLDLLDCFSIWPWS